MSLGVIEFGRQLLTTDDLDPLYVALHGAALDRRQLYRWLISYWCYYHAGLSCYLSEQKLFYPAMLVVARGGTDFPRGTERRHFRGSLAITSIEKIQSRFPQPEKLIDWLVDVSPLTADCVMSRVKQLHGFGTWICWKVPDMLERLGLFPIRFGEHNLKDMFDSSLKGAAEVCKRYLKTTSLVAAHRYLLERLSCSAPPLHDRLINVQEAETIFCKWKSHLNGHYEVGKDTRDIREGLERFDCKTSQRLKENLPCAVK